MRQPKGTAANIRTRDAAVNAMLVSIGATPKEESFGGIHAYRLQTRAGLLRIYAHDGAIFTRFQDVDSACEWLNPAKHGRSRLNPYSGKWNFHFDPSTTPEQAINEFRREFAAIELTSVSN
jgi:hypothetical protein